jgi:hypothetical protein
MENLVAYLGYTETPPLAQLGPGWCKKKIQEGATTLRGPAEALAAAIMRVIPRISTSVEGAGFRGISTNEPSRNQVLHQPSSPTAQGLTDGSRLKAGGKKDKDVVKRPSGQKFQQPQDRLDVHREGQYPSNRCWPRTTCQRQETGKMTGRTIKTPQ